VAGFSDFREIVAWQLAEELKRMADEFLARPEVARRYQFRDQLNDAARSAPRNIAEGFARYRHKEFAQFTRIARASESEVLDHFIDAFDQRLMTRDELIKAEHLAKRAMSAAAGLIIWLESTPDPPSPKYRKKERKPDEPSV
jgi:four helix bundle protein